MVVDLIVVSNQRYSADLDKEMSFLQFSILQLVRLVGVIQRAHQLVYLQQIILTWSQKRFFLKILFKAKSVRQVDG